jgi:catalase
VDGVRADGGSVLAADEQVRGGPSVVFDAVAVLTDQAGAALLATVPPARDFVTDAFAHCKFIGHSPAAAILFEALDLADKLDDGVIELAEQSAMAGFAQACGQLRYWPRAATFN